VRGAGNHPVYQRRELIAQAVPAPLDPQPQRTAERSLLHDLDRDAGAHTDLGEVTQRLAVTVVDPLDEERRSRSRPVQPLAPALRVAASGRRDGIAVRVDRGVAEVVVDASEQPVAHGVLEDLRLGMHLVPRHVERLGEECLQEAVAADHRPGVVRPMRGQRRSVVLPPHDQAVRLKPLEHRRDRRRGDLQHGCERGGRRRLGPAGHLEDRFQGILDRLGLGEPAAGGRSSVRRDGHTSQL